MVRASVEECWGKNASMMYTSVNYKVIRDSAFTSYSTLCTRIQAEYHVDDLWGYSAEGLDSLDYISVHRVEHLAEIHIGCPQPTAEVTRTLSEDTDFQDATY